MPSEKKQWSCPVEGCNKVLGRLQDLIQHLEFHDVTQVTERYLLIDRTAAQVRLYSARALPSEMKEQMQEVPA